MINLHLNVIDILLMSIFFSLKDCSGGGWGHVSVCLVTRLCLTLCNAMDYSPPGPSVHGIFRARVPERIAISYMRGSSWPGIESMSPLQVDSLPLTPPGRACRDYLKHIWVIGGLSLLTQVLQGPVLERLGLERLGWISFCASVNLSVKWGCWVSILVWGIFCEVNVY